MILDRFLTDGIECSLEKIHNIKKKEVKPMKINTTIGIEKYIKNKKNEAVMQGKKELIILASELAKDIELKQRFPMICQAMRNCIQIDDEILHQTPSGNSSTFKVKYKL